VLPPVVGIQDAVLPLGVARRMASRHAQRCKRYWPQANAARRGGRIWALTVLKKCIHRTVVRSGKASIEIGAVSAVECGVTFGEAFLQVLTVILVICIGHNTWQGAKTFGQFHRIERLVDILEPGYLSK